ncbi:hypothetical protein ABB02_01059 [Clostridiaceae bacterium JG1575]|nr:hypothetical protein ABB02_01059 [Clostridiaceae bacterium JG1575]
MADQPLKQSLLTFFYASTLDELRMMNEKRLPGSITYNSLLYLHLVEYNQGCTPSYLSRLLGVSKPAVTAKLNELAARGLLLRQKNPQDGRETILKLSEEGAALYAAYDRTMYRAMAHLEKHFSGQDLALFCRMLDEASKVYLKGGKSDGGSFD